MYRIRLENFKELSYIKPTVYADFLGLSPNNIYILFRGESTTKLSTAKGIISVAYKIPLTDEKMDELLEKHFTKEK